ncbi:MAG: hypothetical protein ACJAVS_000583 [Paracoccaceae bacterium]|jgi:hypothetical protein
MLRGTMMRRHKIKQDRGAWFATVEGFDTKLGVHTTDRYDGKRAAVRLFTDTSDDDTDMRRRQLESARSDGVIVLREYDLETKSVGDHVGVFRGEVRLMDGKPWFFSLERLSK